MDFAHRYTKSVLKDALVYNDHSKPINANTNLNSNTNATVNTDDIRLAIAARSNYQFKPVPPKNYYWNWLKKEIVDHYHQLFQDGD